MLRLEELIGVYISSLPTSLKVHPWVFGILSQCHKCWLQNNGRQWDLYALLQSCLTPKLRLTNKHMLIRMRVYHFYVRNHQPPFERTQKKTSTPISFSPSAWIICAWTDAMKSRPSNSVVSIFVAVFFPKPHHSHSFSFTRVEGQNFIASAHAQERKTATPILLRTVKKFKYGLYC